MSNIVCKLVGSDMKRAACDGKSCCNYKFCLYNIKKKQIQSWQNSDSFESLLLIITLSKLYVSITIMTRKKQYFIF